MNNVVADPASYDPGHHDRQNVDRRPVKAGDSITLEEIKQELAIPPSVFLTGYNLGL